LRWKLPSPKGTSLSP